MGKSAALLQWGGLTATRAANIGLGLAISVFLMRKLGPTPFGLLAMVDGMLGVLGAVGDAGIGASLISDPDRRGGRTQSGYPLQIGRYAQCDVAVVRRKHAAHPAQVA